MKKVIKVNIGNLAFTIEEDGFLILKGYLDEIQDHYGPNENGKEIVEGIEERIAELFIEKSGANSVVQTPVVKEVIEILGRPSAIDEEQGEPYYSTTSSKFQKIHKKLYRNPDNKVLGGVCSGLAAYFSLDVLLVRILFFVLLIGFSFFGMVHIGGGSFMFIAYILLWIVIPEARTVEQKCSMYGEPMNIANMGAAFEKGIAKGKRSMQNAAGGGARVVGAIGRLFSVILAVFFVIVAISGLTTLFFLFLGIEIFQGVLPIDMLDYVQLGMSNTIFLKVFLMAFLMLPLVGMLYGGIKLLFRFKSPRIRPGLVIVLLWIVSVVGLGVTSVKSTRPYWSEAKDGGQLPLSKDADTLYLDFIADTQIPADKVSLNAGYSSYSLFWMDNHSGEERFVVFPSFKLIRQSDQEERVLKYATYSFGHNYAQALHKASKGVPTVSMNDSTITISPMYYSKSNKWDGTHQIISVYVPDSTVVIVKGPIEHNFDTKVSREWIFGNNQSRICDFDRWSDKMEDKFERMERRFDF